MIAHDLVVVDMFCGAGGITTGLTQACRELGLHPKIIAINHWNVAIETHKRNHPEATHWCERVDSLDPRKLTPDGRIDFLIAAPECTHHSVARGGKPVNDQSRASAWQVVRYAEALSPRHILLENVREFTNWGPLCANNKRPLKSKRGQTFAAFLAALESLGYAVEWRILNAADYGEATTRERLFIQAKRGRSAITWPKPTHSRCADQRDLFGACLKPWRPAREIIDWSIPSKSIFSRRKPLAPATLRRIEAGLVKFAGKAAEPFLVILRNNQDAKSVNEPVPTITTSGAHVGLCEPFVLGQQSGSVARSTDSPLPTVATDGAIGLVEPFITPLNHGSGDQRQYAIDGPLPTLTTADVWGLVEPFIVTASHGDDTSKRCRSVDSPLPTVTCSNDHAIVEPFIVPFFGERSGQSPRTHSVSDPLPTITSHGAGALVEPRLAECSEAETGELVQSFLCKYNRTATTGQSVDDPLDTVTTKDRFGLILATAHGKFRLDIRFRMLQPAELARAMGFEEYEFTGSREEQVKQIGNAVSVRTARALCLAILPRFLKRPQPAPEELVA